MNKRNDEFQENLEEKIIAIGNIPPRNRERAETARIAYKTRVNQLARPVSQSRVARHITWLDKFQALFQVRKEKFKMTALATILTILALIAGGTGGTVYASQSSMPDEFLYPVKLLSEDVFVGLASEPESKINLLESYTARRMDEIVHELEQGEPPEDALLTRLETQTREMVQLAIHADEAVQQQLMLRVQEQLMTQQKLMEQIHANANPEGQQSLNQAESMLNNQLQTMGDSPAEPQINRQREDTQNESAPEMTPKAGRYGQSTEESETGTGVNQGGQTEDAVGQGTGNQGQQGGQGQQDKGMMITVTPKAMQQNQSGEYGQGPNQDGSGPQGGKNK